VAWPILISRLLAKGKAAFDRSSCDSRGNSARDVGPVTESIPVPEVTSWATRRASSGMRRRSQAMSRVCEATIDPIMNHSSRG
jgi:hypothetical protein